MSGMRHISSRENPHVQGFAQHWSTIPAATARALVDGIHLVAACFTQGIGIRQLLVSEGGQANAEIGALLQGATGIDCLSLRDSLFRELSGVAAPTGIAAVIDIPQVPAELSPGDAVLLDAVQDAGNVGAILRTAAAAGVRNVLLGPGCAGAWTARVLRGGQGAHFFLAIREQVDLLAALAACPATPVATVAHGGTSLYDLDLGGPIFWLVGNEGAGLSAELVAAAKLRARFRLPPVPNP
jgi:TrmH family RNA methyltransferase